MGGGFSNCLQKFILEGGAAIDKVIIFNNPFALFANKEIKALSTKKIVGSLLIISPRKKIYARLLFSAFSKLVF